MSITDVDGVEVGHAQNLEALTGVTVVLTRGGAIGAMVVRGGAAGTRQVAALHPSHVVSRIHGVVLCGGSAFGLAAADGVMQVLESQGVGFDVGVGIVPIIPTAVIFDLGVGDGSVRPDAAMGAAAARAASSEAVVEGCVGAGTGASVGKLLGPRQATKGGLGTASLRQDDLVVGALAVVNAFGDVRDPQTGRIVAGARLPDGRTFADCQAMIRAGNLPQDFVKRARKSPGENTTLGVVATNAALDPVRLHLVAKLAADAFARVLSPGSTQFDGDLVFALSTGAVQAEPHRVGLLARELLETAILRGIRGATAAGGLPCAADLAASS